MRRFIFNLVSALFSAVKFGIMKLLHVHHFYFDGIQRFSPNTEVILAERGTIRLGRHVRAHRRSKLLAMEAQATRSRAAMRLVIMIAFRK